MLALARDLGSADNIDVHTGTLTFSTREEANAFQDFCQEHGLAVSVREQTAKEAKDIAVFRVAVEEKSVPSAPLDTKEKESGANAQETPKQHAERIRL